MDKLLDDSDATFLAHYQKPLQHLQDIKLDGYIDEDDTGFQLSSLLEMDQHLRKDGHFLEMVHDIERYTSKSYAQNARDVQPLYVVLGGLLKLLLRECISYFDKYDRKVMIEKVYTWYRDKRRLLLEYITSNANEAKRRASVTIMTSRTDTESVISGVAEGTDQTNLSLDTSGFAASTGGDVSQSVSSRPLDSTKLDLTAVVKQGSKSLSARKTSRKLQIQLQQTGGELPYYANQEKKRRVFIKNMLKQYSRRNLQTSEGIRQRQTEQSVESAQRPSTAPAGGRTPSSPQHQSPRTPLPDMPSSLVNTARETTEEAEQRKRAAYLSQTPQTATGQQSSLAAAEVALASVSSPVDEASQQKSLSAYVFYRKPRTEQEESVEKRWVQHRADDVRRTLETAEYKRVVQTWTNNRARIEEEIQRRQESNRYSSQTGNHVHRIVRHIDLQQEQDRKMNKKKQIELYEEDDEFLDSSDDEREIIMTNSKSKHKVVESTQTKQEEEEGSLYGQDGSGYHWENAALSNAVKPLDIGNSASVLLSPYANIENLRTARQNEINVSHGAFMSQKFKASAKKQVSEEDDQDHEEPAKQEEPQHTDPEQKFAQQYGLTRPKTGEHGIFELTQISAFERPMSAVQWSRIQSGSDHPQRPVSAATTRPISSGGLPLSSLRSHSIPKVPEIPSRKTLYPEEKIVVHDVFAIATAAREKKKAEEAALAAKLAKLQAQKDEKGKGKGGKAPPKPPAKAPAKGKGGKDAKPAQPEQQPLKPPSSSIPIVPPSAFRINQLEQAQGIQILLAKSGFDTRMATIRRAIVTPDDLPYAACVEALPKQPNYLLTDATAADKKKKKTTKGKKKKK